MPCHCLILVPIFHLNYPMNYSHLFHNIINLPLKYWTGSDLKWSGTNSTRRWLSFIRQVIFASIPSSNVPSINKHPTTSKLGTNIYVYFPKIMYEPKAYIITCYPTPFVAHVITLFLHNRDRESKMQEAWRKTLIGTRILPSVYLLSIYLSICLESNDSTSSNQLPRLLPWHQNLKEVEEGKVM